ncbi:peptidoglycan-binding domain-containing protein [Paracoccus benzoatiresistens]|uniref:Peptidoglycan-binding domain-containing protein n=1 Tax=Paracoccus benzoatiresistens TaxID=2997341 RepID=A0ABT4J1F0_9RHOB|nr:peptidoglycan-binding protein [Paracoccus sp. EF6]MCZ0960944.1 peptidoglycan-binding domain-containing protein [Paracoccus sp. EF6]
MVRKMLSAAFVAATLTTPVQAQDLGDIVGGVARQYLQQEQDRAAFAQAQSQNTIRGYQSYLQQFPSGLYAAEARQQISRLGGSVDTRDDPYAGGSNSAGLSRDQRVAVQRRLNALGYSTNGADGNFGPGTRRAIALWQRDRNYTQTGSLTTAQANEILRGTAVAGSSSSSAGASSGSAARAEDDIGLSRSQRAAIQAELTRRGYDTRGIDGVFGRGTRGAIASWQQANRMSATGYLTVQQADQLAR